MSAEEDAACLEADLRDCVRAIEQLETSTKRLREQLSAETEEVLRLEKACAEMVSSDEFQGILSELDAMCQFVADVRLGIRDLSEFEAVCGWW